MKIAIITSGPPRGFHHAVKTWDFLPHVITAFSFTRTPFEDDESPINFPHEINASDASESQWFVSGRAMDERPGRIHNAAVTLGCAWEGRLRAFEMIHNPLQYDLIAYIRPDSYFTRPLNLSKLTPDKLWTPKPHSWGGLCDRIAVGSPAAMRWYTHIWHHLGETHNLTIGNMEERLAYHLTTRNKLFAQPPIELGLLDTDFHPVMADGTHRQNDPAGCYYLPQYQYFRNLETR